MKTKRFLALVLSVAMIILTLPTVTLAETTAEVMYSTDNGESWTYDSLMNAIFSYGADVEIKLLKDITLTSSGWSYAPVFANTNANVTIDGQGYTITRGNGVGSFATMAQDGSTLTLKNITIDGGAVWSGDDPATRTNSGYSVANAYLFDVYGGTLILDNGTVICNSHLTGSNSYGGAIAVSQPGKVVMNDGAEIKNCAAVSGGAICVVAGNEAFTMNGGKISNCYASSGGGAIFTQGNAVMNGGELLGNASGNNGGAVTIQSSGVFTLKDGTIKNNASVAGGGAITILGASATLNVEGGEISANTITGSLGGGVLVNAGTFNVSGSPIIKDNKSGTANSNVYLGASKVINLNGALTNTEKIGITMKSIGTFTSGWNTYMGTAENSHFISDNKAYIVSEEATELKLENAPEPIYTISFNANGGSGIMSNVDMTAGDYALPECSFTAPNGYEFKAWSVGDVEKSVGETIAITEDTTVTAVWKALEATAPSISAVSADLTNDNSLAYGEITAEDKLTVTAEADSNTEYNALEYQWYKVASASSKDNAIAISGATNETYAIPTDTAAGDCYYYCAVTATRKDNGEKAIADTRIVSVTINKKPVEINWGTTSFVYDGTEKAVNPTVSNVVSGDTVNLTVTNNKETAAGNYTASVTSVSNNNYTLDGVETTKAWNIVQSATDYEGGSIKAYKGDSEATEFTYGDTITVKVKPYAIGTAAPVMLMSLAEPTENQMALYLGDTQISEAVNADNEGNYTMNVDTTQTVLAYGNITLSAKYVGNDNMASHSEDVTITLSKADAVQTTAPSAVQGLTYNGEQQTLVTAGSEVTGGTIKYKLADGEYSEELPKADNADTYTVYYKIFGDENHNDSSEQSFTVTVGKLPVNITWNMPQSLVFDGSEKTITAGLANKVGNDSVNLTIEGTTTATNKGDYTATVTAIDNENYTLTGGENLTKNWSVAETVNDFTTNLAITGWVFGETPNAPTATAAFGTPEYTYSSSIDGAYSVDVPTEAGTYYVKATVTGTENYAELVSEAVEFTILPKTINTAISLTAPVANAAPQTEIETDEYTATVVWSPDVTDKFAYSTAYTATITITPKANYTVTGISENSYTANGAETVTNTADSATVTVTYAETGRRPSSSGGGVSRYTVKFETNGGSTVASKTVTRNSTVDEPTAPTKDGYTFMGWYTDKELTKAYDFDTKVTKAITLYAKWEKHDDENIDDTPDDKTDTPDAPVWENPFTDVKTDDWYYENVEYAVENGLFNGTTETTFAPNGIITRAMMVTVLYRAEGEPTVTGTATFEDVDSNAYYAKAVVWGQQNGIIKGYSETEFAPDQNITREQIAAIMFRYAQYKDVAPTGAWAIRLDYADLAEIADYATEGVMYCKLKGIMQGKDNNNFAPKDNATRAEMAAILNRFIEANK